MGLAALQVRVIPPQSIEYPSLQHRFSSSPPSNRSLLNAVPAQIREGYPEFTGGKFLTRRTSLVWWFIYMGYSAVPYLYELRTFIDWFALPGVAKIGRLPLARCHTPFVLIPE